ncbi:DUF3606 domain-containing protein [Bradyrhizobium sp.]|uniref:DUF3606 domain-containing protein n=1 Tax=Bradyrhizobium sp. TaxID=376 RepID=UPI003C3DAC02
MNSQTKRAMPDRSKINVREPRQVKCWAHKFKISQDELVRLVERVGSSAAAVRKELAT